MALSILTEVQDKIAIIRLNGDLVVSEVEKLRSEIKELTEKSITKIVLDFTDIDFIDSSGIGLLVEILKSVSKFDGGKLKLVNINRQVKDILKQIQLYSIFEIHDSEEEALKSIN